jgi:L-aminopeptidase/D-esterase-like protein
MVSAAGGALLLAGAARGDNQVSNDGSDLEPDTSPGKHTLRFEFPGLKIGVASYEAGPTGCTALWFPKGAQAVCDIRGGSPATFFTDRLRHESSYVDAICLAGGSVYGLEAATGVAAELFAGRKYATTWGKIAVVTGAILYDFGARENAIYPDKALGRAALGSARAGVFPLGGRGAGSSATCGKWLFQTTRPELAGQGGSFHQSGPTKVCVFTVVNALGAIVDRQGKVVRGHLDPATGSRLPMPDLRERGRPEGPGTQGGNTTLTVVVTNQIMTPHQLRQLAREVHTSMARAIDPFHTLTDGDVLYAVTTGAVKNPKLNPYQLAAIASECAWDAVLNSFTGR